MIRKAIIEDIDSILKITKDCAISMISNNIYQWNDHYPNRVAFENDVKRSELFVIENEETIFGCVVLSTLMDEEYQHVTWLTPSKSNLYIHRLAIDPEYQGKGKAQQLMNYAERYAQENNYDSVRLDTFSQNHRNQKFYELRGYKKLESIYFPKQSKHPFYCYELVF